MANKITVILEALGFDRGATEVKGFRQSIAEADTTTGKFKAGMSSVGQSLKANMSVGMAAAGAAAVAFAAKSVQAFTDTAKAAKDLSSATGLAIEDASRWIAVGDDFQVSADQLTTGIGRIGKTLNADVWKKYGIETRNAAGQARNANDILIDALSTLSGIENETERARVGTDLFGRGYAKLAPLVGHTADEYRRMLGAVEDGQVITEGEAAKAERFRLAQDALADALQEVTLRVGEMVAEMAPAIEQLSSMVGWLTKLGDTHIPGLPKEFNLWTGQITYATKAIEGLTGHIDSKMNPTLADFLQKTKRSEDGTENFADSMEEAKKAAQEEAEALRDSGQAALDMVDARRAAIDSTFAMQRANDEWTKTLVETNEKAAELEKTIQDSSKTDAEKVDAFAELQDLYRKGAESVAEMADAEVRWAEDQAKANGETLTHTESLDLWNRKALAAAAAADGPLKDSIVGIIAEYNNIPESTVTEILANADPGAIEEAAADLDAVSESRDTTVVAEADTTLAEGQISALNGTPVTIDVQILASALRTKIANALGPFAAFVLPGHADGGFTGRGGKHEVAGVVHKGEYVLPQEMVDQTTGRPKGFAAGGFTGTASSRSSGTAGLNLGAAFKDVFDGYASLLDATDALTAAQQRLAKAVEEGAQTLDANTEEGRANRDAVDAQWEAVQKLAEAQFEQGASVQDVTAFLRSNIDALRGQLESLGLASGAIDDYLARLGATPDAIAKVTAELAKQRREADAERRDDALAKQARMEDYLYERQKITAAKYLEILRERLAATEEWGSEYLSILRMIDRVEADLADSATQRPVGRPSHATLPRPARADGTFTIADAGVIDARLVLNAPVYGVADLDAWADARDRKLAATIAAGKRP